jgi:hypothetical protein
MILRFNISGQAIGTAMLSVRSGVAIVTLSIGHAREEIAEANFFLEFPQDTWEGPLTQEQLGEDACRVCLARFLAEPTREFTSAIEMIYDGDQPRWGGRLIAEEKP